VKLLFFPAHLRAFDYPAFLLALIVTVLSALYAYGNEDAASAIVIKGAESSYRYPVSAVETIRVSGPLGESVIVLENGQARVVSSPCQNQTCVAAPAILARGQWIACLPNRGMVLVETVNGETDTGTW
jgi:hypothetical protein